MFAQLRSFNFASLAATLFLALIGISSCANNTSLQSDGVVPFDAQKRAVERSASRWKALIDKRFEESFAYLSTASKAGTSVNEYAAAMQRMSVVSAVVDSAKCEGGLCVVKSNISLPIFVRGVGTRLQTLPVEESWTVNNNELWLIRR
ncbi:MAG: hypothetical protein H7203_10680 [Rhizobacter sp.]|nr:hypothetical protein [Burkholderiales bacterium]